MAGSIVERREGHDKLGNTSVHVGPDGELRGVYRKIHMFDVTVEGKEYRESTSQEAGDEIVTSEAEGARLGLTVCYDLRFPELYRILAVRGARILIVPAAFTKHTGQAHWDTLVRARAIENQAFVIAADQIGVHPPDNESFGGSQIVDPWGEVLADAEDEECFVAADLDLARQDEVRESLPSLANRVPVGLPLARGGVGSDGLVARRRAGTLDKRRMILDAAVTVFARQGFHHCRVSDVADEAGVAYGLVYHYFDSKEEILNELFLERWQIMLDAIAEIDRLQEVPVRDKLYMVASFIIDSYRHEPDLMKVIIVEVTRAANSFGRLHLDEDPRGLRRHRRDRGGGSPRRQLQVRHLLRVRGDVLLRGDRAGAHGLDLRPAAPQTRRSTSTRRAWWWTRSAAASRPRRRMLRPSLVESAPRWTTTSSSASSGAACSPEWAPSPRSWPSAWPRLIWVRVFHEDPPGY